MRESEAQGISSVGVVFCCDENYVVPCMVSAFSLWTDQVESLGDPPAFFVLTDSISPAARAALSDLSCLGLPLSIVELKTGWLPRELETCLAPSLRHISLTTYARFLMARYLPAGIRRAIYLDCDTLVLKSPALLDEVLTIERVGAAIDGTSPADLVRLGLEPKRYIYNAGVLLVNLAYWWGQGVEARLWACGVERKDTLQCCDQDVINIELSEEIERLHIRFNYHEHYWRTGYAEQEIRPWLGERYKLELREAALNPVVVHFNTEVKPWTHLALGGAFFDDWFHALAALSSSLPQVASERLAGLVRQLGIENRLSCVARGSLEGERESHEVEEGARP